MIRFVGTNTVRLELTGGDWIRVKERLNVGEQRAAHHRMMIHGTDGSVKVNPLEVGIAIIVAYLVDWSNADMPIRGASVDDVTAILNNLDIDSFSEIRDAIEAHEAAMTAERDQEKKVPTAGSNGAATSPWPSAVAGASTGSENWTAMTTPSS